MTELGLVPDDGVGGGGGGPEPGSLRGDGVGGGEGGGGSTPLPPLLPEVIPEKNSALRAGKWGSNTFLQDIHDVHLSTSIYIYIYTYIYIYIFLYIYIYISLSLSLSLCHITCWFCLSTFPKRLTFLMTAPFRFGSCINS